MREVKKRVNGVTFIKVIPEPMDSINFFGKKKLDKSVQYEGVKLSVLKDARDWAEYVLNTNSYAELSR